MRPLALLAFLPVLAAAQYPGSQPVAKDVRKGWDTISIKDAQSWLGFLAGPKTMGRGTGQPGFQVAADFVAARFKEFGLKPAGENGTYFQKVPFSHARVRPGSVRLTVDGQPFPNGGIELATRGQKLDGEGTLVVVRATGGKLPAEPDVKDKLVLVVGELPDGGTFQLIRRHPIAILTVKEAVKPYDWRPTTKNGLMDGRFVTGDITKAAAGRLLSSINADPKLLEAPTEKDQLEFQQLSHKITLAAQLDSEDVGVPNVVGMIPGTDPTLKAEIVGLGAHLDHLGTTDGTVYPGADDDGSGSTALLLAARALAKSGIKPKRTILFMEFCGEEMGLIGSSYYADHPVFPHDQMVAEIQMDMVGRDSDGVQNGDVSRVDKRDENVNTIRLVGSKRISTDLDATIQRLNAFTGFKFKYDAEDVYTRSDHYNFAKNGIPIAFFFDGFHPDYHQPTDTVEKIDWVKLTTTARLVYLTATELATRPDRPVKDVKVGEKALGR